MTKVVAKEWLMECYDSDKSTSQRMVNGVTKVAAKEWLLECQDSDKSSGQRMVNGKLG